MHRSIVPLIAISHLIFPVIAVSSTTTTTTTTATATATATKCNHQHQQQKHLRPFAPNPSSSSSSSLLLSLSTTRACHESRTQNRCHDDTSLSSSSSTASFQQYHSCSTSPSSRVVKRIINKRNIINYNIDNSFIMKSKSKSCHNINHRYRGGRYGMMQFGMNSNQQDNGDDDDEDASAPSFLSTDKAKVSFQTGNALLTKNTKTSNNSNSPFLSNTLSPMDRFLLTLTSDRTSLILGSMGILLLLLNRLLTFPEDNADSGMMYEASRSRIDLLGVFAAGSVLLNGITKLDVESVKAEKVVLEGRNAEKVIWDTDTIEQKQQREQNSFQPIVEWALLSYLKCTPAKSAVLLARRILSQQDGSNSTPWMTLARVGTLPFDLQIPNKTPILDRMFRGDSSRIKGGTVGGADVVVGIAGKNRRGIRKESYLPTLQALPGKVEFTYLPSNAQEALILPVSSLVELETSRTSNDGGWHYAVVLGGDVAKSFAPRDIAWCKEIAAWIGELV